MREIDVAALGVRVFVITHVLAVELALALAPQVAHAAAELGAALAHVARDQGGVIVRRQVQVERGAQVEAGVVGLAEDRRQEAGVALAIDGELEVRQPQDRQVLEPQRGIVGVAHALVLVQLDTAGLEQPGLGVRRAGGIADAAEMGPARARHLDAVRLAARGQRDQGVAGLVEHALFADQVVVQALAFDDQGRIAEQRLRIRPQVLVGGVVVHLLGRELAPVLADQHRAGQARDAFLRGIDVVGVEHQARVGGDGRQLARIVDLRTGGRGRAVVLRLCRREAAQAQGGQGQAQQR